MSLATLQWSYGIISHSYLNGLLARDRFFVIGDDEVILLTSVRIGEPRDSSLTSTPNCFASELERLDCGSASLWSAFEVSVAFRRPAECNEEVNSISLRALLGRLPQRHGEARMLIGTRVELMSDASVRISAHSRRIGAAAPAPTSMNDDQ